MYNKGVYFFIFIVLLFSIIGCNSGNPVIPPIDDTNLPEYKEIIEDNQAVIDQFGEFNLNYNAEVAKQKMIEWLAEKSDIEKAGLSEDGTIWFEYKNGIMVGFLQDEEKENKNIIQEYAEPDIYSSLKVTDLNKSIPSNKKAICLAPFSTLNFNDKAGKIREKILKLDGFSCDIDKGSDVTVEIMKGLYKYGIVYMVTHGGIIGGDPCLALNYIITDDFYDKYKSEFSGKKYGRLRFGYKNAVQEWMDENKIADKAYVMVAPSFISAYANQSYPNSLIYVDACYSLANTNMAKAFTGAGAHTYCGYQTKTFALLTCDLTAFDNMIFKGMSVKNACNNTDCTGIVVGFNGLDSYSDKQDNLYLAGLDITINITNSEGEAPLEVEFSGTVSNGESPYTYFWDYGNGEKSQEYEDNYIKSIKYTYQETGNYYPVLFVEDVNGLKGDVNSKQVIVLEPGQSNINHAPEISSLTADPSSIDINQSTTITCTASDVDGDPLTYTWIKDYGTFEGSTSGSTVTWEAPSTKGNYTITCEASDGQASDSDQVVISVTDNGNSDPVHNLTKDTYYNTIQAAINSASSGNTIEVSPGIYYENIDFLGKNITLQSIDPYDSSVRAETIIDGQDADSVVKFTGGETNQAVLKGFTIQNGNAGAGPGGGIKIVSSSPVITKNTVKGNISHSDHGGGGIFICHDASPLIQDNYIYNNQGGYGGGVYVGDHSSPNIYKNKIEKNSSGLHRGGGVFVSGTSSPTVHYNTITRNSAEYGGGICIVEASSGTVKSNTVTINKARYGGGIFCGEGSDPLISQNTFSGNSVTSYGGGLFIGEASPDIKNNDITSNTATNGAGIFLWKASPLIQDNEISSNDASSIGGGIDVQTNSHPIIDGNTISSNTASAGGGIYVYSDCSVKTISSSTWPRQNTPSNSETTNDYSGNEHGSPLAYTDGADVSFQN